MNRKTDEEILEIFQSNTVESNYGFIVLEDVMVGGFFNGYRLAETEALTEIEEAKDGEREAIADLDTIKELVSGGDKEQFLIINELIEYKQIHELDVEEYNKLQSVIDQQNTQIVNLQRDNLYLSKQLEHR